MAAVAVSPTQNQLENPRDKALQDYRKKILEHKEIEGRLKESMCINQSVLKILFIVFFVSCNIRCLCFPLFSSHFCNC